MQKSAQKTAAKTEAKSVAPIAPAAAKAEKPAKAAAPLHFHREAGLTGARYNGASSYLNANRKTAVKLSNYPRTESDIAGSASDRTPGTLYELRDVHGAGKPFPARGIDNAVCAMLITAGLLAIEPKSGGSTNVNGVATLIDLPSNPLRVSVTPAGAKFGKA